MMDDPGRFAQELDAENQSPRSSPIPIPNPLPDGGGADEDPIDFLINRVTVVIHESAQMGTEPLSTIASVLAQLYQAKALRDIAEQMQEANGSLESVLFSRRKSRYHFERRGARRRNPRKSFADIFRDLADAFEESFEDR